MALIDKDALVAEIERFIFVCDCVLLDKDSLDSAKATYKARKKAYLNILSFIDTLEVKEVDLEHLEQEVKDFCYEYDDRKEKWYELCPNDRKLLYNPTWANFAMSIAKHFFELGIIQSVNESIIRKIVDLNDEAAKHYDAIIRKENKENGFSQLAIDLFEHNVDAKELCIQYVIENLKAQKG